MKLSSILSLIHREISIADFKNAIRLEIDTYQKSFKIKGGSSPIYLEEDIKEIKLNGNDVKFLCTLLENRDLNLFEFNYLIEALLLSERTSFSNDSIKIALEDLTDPEYGLNLTKDYIKKVLSSVE